jgi:hypothetical protein
MKISPLTYVLVGVAVAATVLALLFGPKPNVFRAQLTTQQPGFQTGVVALGHLPIGMDIPIRVKLDGADPEYLIQPTTWMGSCPCTTGTILTTGGLTGRSLNLDFILNTVASPGNKETVLTGKAADGRQMELTVRYVLPGSITHGEQSPWEIRQDDGHPWYMTMSILGEPFTEEDVVLDVAAPRLTRIRIHQLERQGDRSILTIRSNTATIETTGNISLGLTVRGTALEPVFRELPVLRGEHDPGNPADFSVNLGALFRMPTTGTVAIADLTGNRASHPGFRATLEQQILSIHHDLQSTYPRTAKLLGLPTGVVLLYPNQVPNRKHP